MMGFYDHPKDKRKEIVSTIHHSIREAILKKTDDRIAAFFADADTYIRKSAYQSVGKIYLSDQKLHDKVIYLLKKLFRRADEKIRQTVINAAGEIGRMDFDPVAEFMDAGLFDKHHSVRNAVIGSLKKMAEKNPVPVLAFAKNYLAHPDKEIRREICHGIELRGRTHPEDILPLLRELQYDTTARVSNTLVHVIGQISYKKGCLEKVIADLKTWENKTLVEKALLEIIDVHDRYKDFAFYSKAFVEKYIHSNF